MWVRVREFYYLLLWSEVARGPCGGARVVAHVTYRPCCQTGGGRASLESREAGRATWNSRAAGNATLRLLVN